METESNYEHRKKLLFASLETAENSIIKGSSLEQKEDADTSKNLFLKPNQRGRRIKQVDPLRFQGKESIFKREHLPIEKCLKPRHVPDFKINPQKWKKYSLEDTDISDNANTTAAFQFLREIEDRKRDKDTEDKMETEFSTHKITFNKSTNLKNKMICEKSTEILNGSPMNLIPTLKGSKLVMPEYVVGQKIKKDRKKVIADRLDKKELKLDHLMANDEEEEESNQIN